MVDPPTSARIGTITHSAALLVTTPNA